MAIQYERKGIILAGIYPILRRVAIYNYDGYEDCSERLGFDISQEEFIIVAQTWLLLNGFDYEQPDTKRIDT